MLIDGHRLAAEVVSMRSQSWIWAVALVMSAGIVVSLEGAFSAEAIVAARAEKDASMRDEPTSPFNYEKHPVAFSPLRYFEPNPDWVFESRLEVYAEPEAVTIYDTKGRERKGHLYGHLNFARDGFTHEVHVYRMETKGGHHYAIWFTDLTTGESTYEVGRYLDFELSGDADHVYVLDFNLAYNPWCAYSPAYGCAIPRQTDFLELAIEAGEKKWHD
jgi:uncharacterized protein (DUF1684 family)